MNLLKRILRLVFGLLFVSSGCFHFLRTEIFTQIMPDYLPWHRELVWISGAAEITLGILLQIGSTQTLAAWGLCALLVAVFPANINMALHADRYPDMAPLALWLRLPIQGVLLAWAYWYTRSVRGTMKTNQ